MTRRSKGEEWEGAAPAGSVWAHVLIAVFSLTLVSLAFHPTDAFWLAWVAFVPWMSWHAARPRRGTARALCAGYYLHFVLVLSWVSEVAPALNYLIPLLGLPFVAAMAWALDRSVHRLGLPPLLVYPLAIISMEVARDACLGLTWSSVGYTQWRAIPLLQWASVFRVHGVSLAVLLVNAGLAQGVVAAVHRFRREEGSRAHPLAAPGLALAILGVMWFAGLQSMAATVLEEGPRAVGIQPNISVYDRIPDRFGRSRRRCREIYREGGGASLDPDLLVYPETSIGVVYRDRITLDDLLDHPADPASRRGIRADLPAGRGQLTVLGYNLRVPIDPLSGVVDEDRDGYQEMNVAGVLRDGRDLIGTYAKRGTVPFGETIPLPEGFPGREALKDAIGAAAGYVPDLTAGTGPLLVDLETPGGPWRFGIVICYEAVFPRYFRELAALGADFVVNISNDGWYRRSNELDLVQVAVQFRAVETRRSVFRVSNTGISALVDPLGRTVAMVERGGERKEISGLLEGRIPVCRSVSPYVLLGDLPTWGFALAWALAALQVARRRRRSSP